MKRGGIAIACALGALAVPVAVVAGGGGFLDQSVPTAPQQSVWGTTDPASTNSDQYEAVPGMPQGTEVTLDLSPPAPLYLSVDMKSGKAQFRVVDGNGDTVNPRSVLISGKGVSTATFLTLDDGLEDPTIEWKRKGNQRAELISLVASTLGEND